MPKTRVNIAFSGYHPYRAPKESLKSFLTRFCYFLDNAHLLKKRLPLKSQSIHEDSINKVRKSFKR